MSKCFAVQQIEKKNCDIKIQVWTCPIHISQKSSLYFTTVGYLRLPNQCNKIPVLYLTFI